MDDSVFFGESISVLLCECESRSGYSGEGAQYIHHTLGHRHGGGYRTARYHPEDAVKTP